MYVSLTFEKESGKRGWERATGQWEGGGDIYL